MKVEHQETRSSAQAGSVVVSRWGSWLSCSPPLPLSCPASIHGVRTLSPCFLALVHVIPWIALTCSVKDPHPDLFFLRALLSKLVIWDLLGPGTGRRLSADSAVRKPPASRPRCFLPLSEPAQEPLPASKQRPWDGKVSWRLARRHPAIPGVCSVYGSWQELWSS